MRRDATRRIANLADFVGVSLDEISTASSLLTASRLKTRRLRHAASKQSIQVRFHDF
jgi:hypothetical protein